jgi:meiotically up-regulated gene 157 (Mug157) protein
VVQHPHAGEIWAYEVDGLGHYVAMDDANIPSLLSAPYLGYCALDDPLYQRTRQFVLSPENPSYYEGRYLRGVGSPHTPARNVWPLGVAMQALTSGDRAEALGLLRMLRDTTDGTSYMHESIDGDDPHRYTRPWFAWANSLCAELIMHLFAPGL